MAESSAEIKKLIRLRNQRPSFSRMISWDISQAAEQQPVKKSKQKKKKVSMSTVEINDETTETNTETEHQCNEVDATSSDSSDYETACEDEEDIVVKVKEFCATQDPGASKRLSESCDIVIVESSSELDVDDVFDEEDDEGDDDSQSLMSSMSSDKLVSQAPCELQQGRRRRPSKKQKRKRKKYFRMTYVDELYNLASLFDPTDAINDVFTEVAEAGSDVNIRHKVPSLVELCMKANMKKTRASSITAKCSNPEKTSSSVLPYGMKRLLANWGRGQKQLEHQLSFFLNTVLPIVEEKVSKKLHVLLEFRNENAKLSLPKRSVWAVTYHPPTKSSASNTIYPSVKSPAFLFTPSMHYHKEMESYYYVYQEHYMSENRILTCAMSALATTVDLMLANQNHMTTPIIRVKRALGLRYKHLVGSLFERVLPYVMWARGRVDIATGMFKNLIDKDTEVDDKAMYLSEIARMHAMFGDCETAVIFYRLASETAVEGAPSGEGRDAAINEVMEQKQVLLASVYDVGLLDEEKAVQSNSYWSGVKHIPHVRTSTMIAGADAYLCYHLSHCNKSKPYNEAISKLERKSGSCSYLYYYQSMIHALQGDGTSSTKLYRQSTACCYDTPGDIVLSLMERRAKKNPWQPLIDLFTSQKLDVKPLHVVWRTNLQPPRISKDGPRPMEGQINSSKLNLRLSEAGHLTGDIQMMLPPLRDVSLDLYTGALVIDNIPSHTGTWTSTLHPENQFIYFDLLVPTPILIYTGEDGTTVHMVKPSNTSSFNKKNLGYFESTGPPGPFMLYWIGPHGHMAKLNILKEIKDHYRKKVIRHLEDKHDNCIKSGWSESDYQLSYKFVEIAYEKNYRMAIETVEDAMRSFIDARKKQDKKRAQNEKTLKKQSKKSLLFHMKLQQDSKYEWLELLGEPFIFGKTIVLQLRGHAYSDSIIIFVNTANKSSFQSCVIGHVCGASKILKQGRNHMTDEEYFMTASTSRLSVYGGTGEIIFTLEDKEMASHCKEHPPVVIYPHVYGLTKENNSIWRTVIGLDDGFYDGFYVDDNICWTIGPVFDELSQGSINTPSVCAMTYVGKTVKSAGKLLMVNLTAGLGFIDPATMQFVPVNIREGCPKLFELTTGGSVIKGSFENCEILAEKSMTVDSRHVYRVAFGVQNKVFVLELSHAEGDAVISLEMTCALLLPGLPKEVCFVGKQVGMLICLTQHLDNSEHYREHVFHFDFNGYLHGVLLCLGHGPRSFLPLYLRGNQESCEGQGQPGWYVYLRDGRDGIMCIRLHK